MARTPEEEAELQILLSMNEEDDAQQAGHKAIDTVRQRTRRPPPPTAPISVWRIGVGGLRDAAQGVIDTVEDIGAEVVDHPLSPSTLFLAPFGALEATRRITGVDRPELPDFEASARAGTPEKVLRSIVSFAVPFTAGLKATSALRAVSYLGRAGEGLAGAREFTALGNVVRGAAAGSATDFTQLDPVSGNIANTIRDVFGLDNGMLDALASDPDDSSLEQRFKAAIAGTATGVLADGVVEAGGKLLRLYRGWKGTADEAAAVVDSIKQGHVQIKDPSLREAQDALDLSTPAKAADGEAVEATTKTKEVPENAIIAGEEIKSMDDLVGFLKSKVGSADADPELIARLGRHLLEGDPEKALTEMGLDPLKLDFSKFSDPDSLGRLLAGMEDVFLQMANRLGRTGTRVTEKVLIRGSQALASTPDVLRALYENTGHLAEKLLAGRLFVGAHAHRLMADAKLAMEELKAGTPGPAWTAFLESFHRHALFMGSVRGAGSEVGRALRSLQFLAKVSPKQAKKILTETIASDAEAKVAQGTGETLTVPEGASVFADTLETNAEKLAALQKLLKNGGDVEELSRRVREGAGKKGSRISEMVKESMGNLFTTATGFANSAAGLTYLGLNTVGRYAAVLGRAPSGLLGGARANAEFRRAAIEAWAYTEGLLGGFREAAGNTFKILERELLLEGSLNADAIGLNKLASSLTQKAIKAEDQVTGHFERADIVTNKAIAFKPNEITSLQKSISEMEGHDFFKAGLKALVRIAAVPANAVGTLTRAGTTLFINAPDEFIGTLATRAGAYAEAVRIGAAEAAELGIEGKELGRFIKNRSVQLFGDGPTTWANASKDAGAAHSLARAGETEANAVLFKDRLELPFNRGVANLHRKGGPLVSIIVPFIKTPLRILERTALDYTPLGILSNRFRTAIKAGGSQRDEALARLSLGMMAVATAYELAGDRTMVGKDGGSLSSARDAGRLSYSIRIGGDQYEYSRLDPLGTLLGLGADLREAIEAAGDDPEAGSMATEIFKALTFGVAANVLSKSWLTSIRNLTDLAGATSPDDASTRWGKFTSSLGARFIPGSGVQRGAESDWDPYMREALSFSEGLLKASVGAGELPIKRDVLGRPVENEAMSHLGVRGSFTAEDGTDPVAAEFERLSFRVPEASRVQKGVHLNSTQYSRFLELRGQVVRNKDTGLTMEEQLKALVAMPEYQSLTKSQRILEMKAAMDGFTADAADALTQEDQKFAYARLRDEVFVLSNKEGWDHSQREAASVEFAKKLGITPQ